MSYVFVSFSKADGEAGRRIVDALDQAGLTVWKEEASQANIPQERESAIKSAQCVIAIWSEAAKKEYASHDEFSEPIKHAIQAWSSGRLVLATLDDTRLPIGLRDLSPISVKDNSGLANLTAGVSEIIRENKRRDRRLRSGFAWWIAAGCALVVLGIIGLRSLSPDSKQELAFDLARRVTSFGDVRLLSSGRLEELGNGLQAEIGALTGAAPNISSPDVEDRDKTLKEKKDLLTLIKEEEQRRTAEKSSGYFLFPYDLIALAFMAILAGAIWYVFAKRRSTKRATYGVVSAESTVSEKTGTLIFVSYSHRDQTLVDQLTKQILALGCVIWIDRKEWGSRRYAGPIVEAIQNSRLVALMCSKNAFLSDHVIREVYIAGKYKKSFIIFKLDSITVPDELEYFLSGFPVIQVSEVSSQQLRSEIARFISPE
jgi:TIR domain